MFEETSTSSLLPLLYRLRPFLFPRCPPVRSGISLSCMIYEFVGLSFALRMGEDVPRLDMQWMWSHYRTATYRGFKSIDSIQARTEFGSRLHHEHFLLCLTVRGIHHRAIQSCITVSSILPVVTQRSPFSGFIRFIF